jgi:hypothetical protein
MIRKLNTFVPILISEEVFGKMNLKDIYIRVILTIIAVLLALILMRPQVDLVLQNAEARTATLGSPVLDVTLVKNIPVTGLRNVVVLGDAKTFIVQQKEQVSVYRVDYITK